MTKETTAVKFAGEVLSSKSKFRRFIIILATILTACIIALGIGFYTGAITWHGGKEKIEKRNDN